MTILEAELRRGAPPNRVRGGAPQNRVREGAPQKRVGEGAPQKKVGVGATGEIGCKEQHGVTVVSRTRSIRSAI